MHGVADIVDLGRFVDQGAAALGAAAQLGVSRHPASRFEQYMDVLQEAAAFTYPQPFPWPDDLPRRALFFEAASQMQQFIDAASIWKTLDPALAAKKVRLIVSGSAHPPRLKEAADLARNSLFEFTVAKALANKGFAVTLTDRDADVVATYPDVGTFDIECKRPTHRGSLASNVRKAASQLRRRCKGTARIGFAVFGVERVLGLGSSTPNLPSLEVLERGVDEILRGHIVALRQAERATKVRLFPQTPLGGVLLNTSIFLEDRGGIFTVSQMGLFATSPGSPECDDIQRKLSATIQAV